MSPFDRIAQLNARVSSLEDENAVLRSQLADARKQSEADSATIAKLAMDKQELVSALRRALDGLQQEQNRNKSVSAATLFLALKPILSRHA